MNFLKCVILLSIGTINQCESAGEFWGEPIYVYSKKKFKNYIERNSTDPSWANRELSRLIEQFRLLTTNKPPMCVHDFLDNISQDSECDPQEKLEILHKLVHIHYNAVDELEDFDEATQDATIVAEVLQQCEMFSNATKLSNSVDGQSFKRSSSCTSSTSGYDTKEASWLAKCDSLQARIEKCTLAITNSTRVVKWSKHYQRNNGFLSTLNEKHANRCRRLTKEWCEELTGLIRTAKSSRCVSRKHIQNILETFKGIQVYAIEMMFLKMSRELSTTSLVGESPRDKFRELQRFYASEMTHTFMTLGAAELIPEEETVARSNLEDLCEKLKASPNALAAKRDMKTHLEMMLTSYYGSGSMS